MPSTIERFVITRYQFPRSRPIGDSQVQSDMHYIGALELYASTGHAGLGFFHSLFHQLPSQQELQRVFVIEQWPALGGQSPSVVLNRLNRPRGGNIQANFFSQAIDQALWDLAAKEQGLPLYKLLGGTTNRVPAYASGLEFRLPIDAVRAFYAQAKDRGFSAFKLKVGHPDLAWDLERIGAIVEVVGRDALLMVDANEAWSPKEAIRRAYAYRDAGFKIYWIEDPCLRDDFAGLARVAQEVPFTYINSGEYLDLRGKRTLLEQRAVDILNIHGHISDGLKAGWLAGEYGIPIALGNTMFEVGVHLAAALPEVQWMEYSFLDYDQLLEEPVNFQDGYAYAPERPGHGLVLAEAARAEYARPEVS
jgi:L-alanine-DL-glutamate epimerase-like enolase superfamily enzyme